MFDCKVEYLHSLFLDSKYPWDMLNRIGETALSIVKRGIEGFSMLDDGVLVGGNVKISPYATIIPPVVLGDDTEVRTGAYLRGNVITGKGCVIGNSTELKNCILLDNVQVPHYNYVGDSILGNKVHLGAGAVCSNLKSDGKSVYIHSNIEYDTGMRKLGAILADGADIGCGCVLNPGTIIGKNTSVYPLTSVRGVIPGDSIVKTMDNIIIRKEVL